LASFFQVDLDALHRFVDSLHQSDEHMTQALDAMKAAGNSVHIGTGALNGAANDFQDTWHYGITQIHSMTKETGDGVNQAYSAYQQVEQALSDVLKKMSGALGGGK
jgi:uncharacterized protein YukE